MPIYEFLCASCGNTWEHLVLGEAGAITCPSCGGRNLKKLLSVTASASGVKGRGDLPGAEDTACCGSRPGTQNCIPGSCCGKSAG